MPALDSLTTADLRDRLADTAPPADPTDVLLPAGIETWPAEMREAMTRSLRPAGVLIPVVDREPALTVLLTRRSAELKRHAGQVAFPGGTMEPDDADVLETALRETHEEVGIAPADVSVLGYLPPMPTATGYAVTPVIGSVGPSEQFEIDRNEVEFAFEVPLAFLIDEANERVIEREFYGGRIPTVEFIYQEHRIWGATAHMLVMLRKILFKQ